MRVQCTCRTCGAVFFDLPSNVARGQGKYCSRRCFGRSQGEPPADLVCQRCGAAFRVKGYRATSGEAKYCSIACRGAGPRTDLRARFWAGVDRSNPEGCWPWMRAQRNDQGHGGVWDGKRWTHAHRVAYRLTYGPIPEGMHVCHRCDSPRCCRPDHLFLGSHAENMADMASKRRTRRVPAEIEDWARLLLRVGATYDEVAATCGIGRSTLKRIRRRD